MDKSEFEEFMNFDVVANDLRRGGGYIFGELIENRTYTVVLRGRSGGEAEVGHADLAWMMFLDDFIEAHFGQKVMLRERTSGRVRYGWLRQFTDGLLYVEAVRVEHLPKMKEDYWEYTDEVYVIAMGDVEYVEPYDFPLEDPSADESEEPLLDDMDGELEVEGDYFEDEDEGPQG